MLSPDHKAKIMRADTEYGKTIDELDYKFGRKDVDFPISVVVPLQKFSQLDTPVDDIFHFAGVGGKDCRTIFNVTYDSRDPMQVVKKEMSKKYESGPEITCISTSVDGFVVTGDAHGAIRIYNDISSNAKLLLDQLKGVSSDEIKYPKGDPVIGIDITADRAWILWTTPTFCALVKIPDQDVWEKGSKGVEKPYAIILKIRDDDLKKYNIKSISLLPAKFDVGPSQDLSKKQITESYVISFLGPYKVVWNMRHVKADYNKEEHSSYGRLTPVESYVLDYAPDYGRSIDESVIALGDSVRHLKFE